VRVRVLSDALFQRARRVLPGGVDSPVRAFKSVGGRPLFIARGSGSHIIDVDGNSYIDYVLSWGPLILGHAHPAVVSAIHYATEDGTSFGAPHASEVTLAETIMDFMPKIEMLRFVNSGTEAVMSAIRVARAFTRRDCIIKFEGNYHGHADSMLVKAGSGVATLGLPDSPGVPAGAASDTLVAAFNDINSVRSLFEANPDRVAAVIIEPVAGNMGVIPPLATFLHELRDLCSRHGSLLIFDEVMTGFRVHPGGAQEMYGVTPDLTTLGKVIGGGLPVGAYGGRRDIMQLMAPEGPVYQAGTLSGNPLAMSAGIATLTELATEGVWDAIAARCTRLCDGLASAANLAGIPVQVNRAGTMFTLFFSANPVIDWPTAKQADPARFRAYFDAMMQRGVYFAPSAFEAGFVSAAHSEEDIDQTISAARFAFERMGSLGV